VVDLRGVHLTDPLGESMPSGPDDPRVYDQDNDGNPGLTVEVSGIVSGQTYIIQRDISSMEGFVLSQDRAEGLVSFTAEFIAVGATSAILMQMNDYQTWTDPVAENSYVIFQRIDPSWTCADIMANKDTLF
jgi:hypothetical protein